MGRCFHGPRCRFARGHIKNGESTEAFADGITNVISKGVLNFINLPVGEGGDDGSPKNKRKGRELAPLRIPDYGWDWVLSDATRRQSTKESHLTANSRSLYGMIGGLGWSENVMQGPKTHGTVGIIAG